MSEVISAIKHVYYLNNGAAYDAVALKVLQYYKRGGPSMVKAFLQSKEMYADPCAKVFRELLKIRTVQPAGKMFSFCQAKRDRAPDWIKDHGWRINRWPDFLPYIHPTETK